MSGRPKKHPDFRPAFRRLKSEWPGCLLLFVGAGMAHAYAEDAEPMQQALGLAPPDVSTTGPDKGLTRAAFPACVLERNIALLKKAGHRVKVLNRIGGAVGDESESAPPQSRPQYVPSEEAISCEVERLRELRPKEPPDVLPRYRSELAARGVLWMPEQ